MPRCPRCGGDHDAEDLVRHERASTVLVHCPDCTQLLGRYRDPGRDRDPATRSR